MLKQFRLTIVAALAIPALSLSGLITATPAASDPLVIAAPAHAPHISGRGTSYGRLSHEPRHSYRQRAARPSYHAAPRRHHRHHSAPTLVAGVGFGVAIGAYAAPVPVYVEHRPAHVYKRFEVSHRHVASGFGSNIHVADPAVIYNTPRGLTQLSRTYRPFAQTHPGFSALTGAGSSY